MWIVEWSFELSFIQAAWSQRRLFKTKIQNPHVRLKATSDFRLFEETVQYFLKPQLAFDLNTNVLKWQNVKGKKVTLFVLRSLKSEKLLF